MQLNQKLAALAFATTAAIASFGVQASTIDVKVIGTITPGACTPTLSGGGVYDFELIGASQLNRTTSTTLPGKTVPLTITCDAPTKVALRVTDNQASSLVAGIPGSFGLGTVAGENVGNFGMTVRANATADGRSVTNLFSNNSGTTWQSGGDNSLTNSPTFLASWAATGTTPVAFTSFSGELLVVPVLNRGQNLTLTNDIPLNGSVTIDLVYL